MKNPNIITLSAHIFEAVPELAKKVQDEYNKAIIEATEKTADNKYLTDLQQEKVNNGKDIKVYSKNIINKFNQSYEAYTINKLQNVYSKSYREVKSITIITHWGKGEYGALQCKATATVIYNDGIKEYEGRKTGGCGYDKESTATASVLNLIPSLRQDLCHQANEALKLGTSYRSYIGYGSGCDDVPYFEGGVGFNCHQHILEGLGYKCQRLHSDKHSDVYMFSR